MRKNYFYLFFLSLFTTLSFAQKVTITPTVVNGSNVNSGPINLASVPYSTISLSVKVEVPAGAAIGDQGTIKIYYMNSVALGANVAIGGDGGALYFGGGKVATRNFTINLSWGDFQTSGGFIYAEYRNSNSASAPAFASPYLSVIKNPTMTSGTIVNPPSDAPNPTKIPNTLCCDQIVRLGDKPAPITGSTYLNPYQNKAYGINSTWIANGLASVRFISNSPSTLEIDYLTEPGKFTITRGLGYNYNGQYPNKSNAITITVVPSPFFTTTIMTNNTPNSDGYYELSSVKKLNLYGFVSKVNLNILQDPLHANIRGDEIVNADGYRWEYKNNNSSTNPWVTIPNETLADLNFSDPSQLSSFEDTNYSVRRVAIYKNVSRISNELKILVRGLRLNNTICCDQILKIQSPTNFDNPQIITGSTPNVDSFIPTGSNFQIESINYQWQSQSLEGGYPVSAWSNILGATSKDYLPSQTLTVGSDRRGNYNFKLTYKYRRIATIYYYYVSVVTNKVIYRTETSFSNETSLDGTFSQPYIQIYPNPASSILNIECTADMANTKITISNVMGNIVNSNNYSFLNSKSISIDVSNLPSGTYFITMENQYVGIVQKTFLKQ